MPADRHLLAEFLRVYPFQPATAWWRAVEIGELMRFGHLLAGLCLDVGCGDGLLTRIIDRHAGPQPRTWVGIDPDPAEVALARQLGFYAELMNAPADRIEQPDAHFDCALSNSVLEHIPEVDAVLREVGRVLKPGAPFLVSVPSADFHGCLGGPSAPRRALLRQTRADYLHEIDRRTAHVHYRSEAEWRDGLAAAGFAEVRCSSYFTAPQVRRWETLSNLTAGLLHRIHRRPPIEIQRSLGLRRSRSMPARLAGAVAPLVAAGVGGAAQPCGGLMIVAYRGA